MSRKVSKLSNFPFLSIKKYVFITFQFPFGGKSIKYPKKAFDKLKYTNLERKKTNFRKKGKNMRYFSKI